MDVNSEAMSESSWSIMVETRPQAILGNGTLFFLFLLSFEKKKKKELFFIDNTNTKRLLMKEQTVNSEEETQQTDVGCSRTKS